jgi:hypothetical protein
MDSQGARNPRQFIAAKDRISERHSADRHKPDGQPFCKGQFEEKPILVLSLLNQ